MQTKDKQLARNKMLDSMDIQSPCDASPYGVVGESLFGHARTASGSPPRYASLKIEVDSRED